jgi:hypothetical protein
VEIIGKKIVPQLSNTTSIKKLSRILPFLNVHDFTTATKNPLMCAVVFDAKI